MNGYPLAVSSWDNAERAAIEKVMDSGHYTMGNAVTAFECEFAAYVGSQFAVMVNSGSSANLLAVAALCCRKERPLRRGDEVIVPAISWATTYTPLSQYGLRLKFVDIDAQTLNMDLGQLRHAITAQTRLIAAVNLLGNANDFSEVRDAIGTRDIELLEDNCEALGAEFDGQQTGTFGIMGTFSFYFSHHISTMEGGMVVTDDEKLYHVLLSLRSHGWTRNLPQQNHIAPKSSDSFREAFRFVLPGYNLRPLEMSGAVGSEQLKKLPSFLDMRRQNATHFQAAFADTDRFLIQRETGRSSHFGFSLVIRPESEISRDSVIAKLADNAIETRPIVAGNFVKNEVLAYMDHEIVGDLPNANLVDQHGFYVGNHHLDLRPQIDLLARVLLEG